LVQVEQVELVVLLQPMVLIQFSLLLHLLAVVQVVVMWVLRLVILAVLVVAQSVIQPITQAVAPIQQTKAM
jgi:hypothetical protein